LGISKTFNFSGNDGNSSKNNLLVDLKLMNVFNKNYQVIRSFPMPGRYLQLRLKYDLTK
jgi:outer membrane cobalamin receptor